MKEEAWLKTEISQGYTLVVSYGVENRTVILKLDRHGFEC